MKNIQAYEVGDNLDPILLFTVVREYKVIQDRQPKVQIDERGVYYIPQRGVGMKGLTFDGSTVTVARRILNMGKVTIKPGMIDIPKVNVDSIVKAVNDWMRTWMGKDEDENGKEGKETHKRFQP